MNALLEFFGSVVALLDYPLGWLLALPRDVTVLLIAVGTCVLLTLTRKWTTDQRLLRCCKADLSRLKDLFRQAKQANDKNTLNRIRQTQGMIKWLQMKSEFPGFAASVIPVVLLAVWATDRLGYYPPQAGQTVTLKATFPVSSVDQLAYVVPPEHVVSTEAPICLVQLNEEKTLGVAEWRLKLAQAGDTQLTIRHRGQTVSHPLRIGQRTYAPLVEDHDGRIQKTEIELPEAKLFGVVPSFKDYGLASWMIGYLAFALVLIFPIRRLLHVA